MRPRVGSRVTTTYGGGVLTVLDAPGTLRALCGREGGGFLGLADLYKMTVATTPCTGCGGVGAHASSECPVYPSSEHGYVRQSIVTRSREPACRVCDRHETHPMHATVRVRVGAALDRMRGIAEAEGLRMVRNDDDTAWVFVPSEGGPA